MKPNFIFAFLFMLALYTCGFSQQPNPDCSTLLVDDLVIDNDTASLVKVRLKNTCNNCATGLNGCVYVEIKVIRTVAPFDTLAESKCYCHSYPANNGGTRTYLLPGASVSSLPPFSQLRVSSLPNCGCDTIPFSGPLVSGIAKNSRDDLSLSYLSDRQQLAISAPAGQPAAFSILNLSAMVISSGKTGSDRTTVSLSGYPDGIYFVKLMDERSGAVRVLKLVK